MPTEPKVFAVAQSVPKEPCFLLVKRGLYYRPDNQGYTGKKSEAGRYFETDAWPCGTVTAIHQDEAGEYAPACWMETKLADKDAQVTALREALKPLAAIADWWGDAFCRDHGDRVIYQALAGDRKEPITLTIAQCAAARAALEGVRE
jgi:hypothetical protein